MSLFQWNVIGISQLFWAAKQNRVSPRTGIVTLSSREEAQDRVIFPSAVLPLHPPVESVADKTLWISRRDSIVRHGGRSALSGRKLVASWTVAAFGRPPESLSTLVIRRRFLSSRWGSETFPKNFGNGDVHMYWTYICMKGWWENTRTRVPRFCRNLSEEFFVAALFGSSWHRDEMKERVYHRREFFFVEFADSLIEF